MSLYKKEFYEQKIAVEIVSRDQLEKAFDILKEYVGLKTFNHDGFTGKYETDDFKSYIKGLPNLTMYFYRSLGGVTYNFCDKGSLKNQGYIFIAFNDFLEKIK